MLLPSRLREGSGEGASLPKSGCAEVTRLPSPNPSRKREGDEGT